MKEPAIRIGGEHCGRDGNPYHPVKGLLSAANTALLLQAPLFLAGEPGCGKTDFAWYAAKALAQAQKKDKYQEEVPLQCYVHSDTRARDLLYHYDTLARFADSHDSQSLKEARDVRRYIELRALGLALMSKTQQVILLDEIDKAPRDLPNDLLRELDQGHFEIPEIPTHLEGDRGDRGDPSTLLQRQMMRPRRADGSYLAKPLVIVVSNAERQLPEAFLRRCVYFYIKFPSKEALLQIVWERYGNEEGNLPPGSEARRAMFRDAIDVVDALRSPSSRLTKPPGTAEILGFARALLTYGGDPDFGSLDGLHQAAEAARQKQGVPWAVVPGMFCLLKLKEDFEMLELLTKGV
jgi:MoxR-like ATPase